MGDGAAPVREAGGGGVSADPSVDAARLADELAGMVGSEVWSTELGIGSHLTIDMGDRIQQRKTFRGKEYFHIVGEWRLWVQLAAWRLEDTANVLLGSEDSRPAIAEGISVLQGRRVTAVEVRSPGFDTLFHFGDIRLLLFSVYSALSAPPGESAPTQWSLWRPQGDIVSVELGPSGGWTTEPSTAHSAPVL